jgi:hypothetical protein
MGQPTIDEQDTKSAREGQESKRIETNPSLLENESS